MFPYNNHHTSERFKIARRFTRKIRDTKQRTTSVGTKFQITSVPLDHQVEAGREHDPDELPGPADSCQRRGHHPTGSETRSL
jgi:hypothetical protein